MLTTPAALRRVQDFSWGMSMGNTNPIAAHCCGSPRCDASRPSGECASRSARCFCQMKPLAGSAAVEKVGDKPPDAGSRMNRSASRAILRPDPRDRDAPRRMGFLVSPKGDRFLFPPEASGDARTRYPGEAMSARVDEPIGIGIGTMDRQPVVLAPVLLPINLQERVRSGRAL